MLPNLTLLNQIQQQILNIPNQRKETKRTEHYCLFLLGYKAGLRVSEAVNFDPSKKTRNGLYRLNKTKGKKERLVYIPKQVISELKKHNWQPNRTNRFNFYHFLRKIKRELSISPNIELTPHTLRRAFATHHAEAGLPLPLLSKLLGHSSVRTTALYWMNTYHPDDDDTNTILCGKNWLERHKPVKPESKLLIINEISPQLDRINPLIKPARQKLDELTNALSNYQQELAKKNQQITQLITEKDTLQRDLSNSNNQSTILNQELSRSKSEKEQTQQILAEKDQTIAKLEQALTNEKEKCIEAKSNLTQQKQTANDLQQQLQNEQETNTNLTQTIANHEQNHTNLQNAYHQALKDKGIVQKQLNHLIETIKAAAKQLHQLHKINYYQQLEKQNEFKV